jgi:hypothetical protein
MPRERTPLGSSDPSDQSYGADEYSRAVRDRLDQPEKVF